MSGYYGFSKSNNAVDAEEVGRFPASECARRLGVPVEFVRAQGRCEWHHSSKYYNRVDYYDLDEIREYLETPEGAQELAEIKAKLAAKKTAPETVYENADVQWLEWYGSRRHPRCRERYESGATVTDRGGHFVEIKLASGRTFKKSRATRGFIVRVDGKKVIG